jgi:hypothetical protein
MGARRTVIGRKTVDELSATAAFSATVATSSRPSAATNGIDLTAASPLLWV